MVTIIINALVLSLATGNFDFIDEVMFYGATRKFACCYSGNKENQLKAHQYICSASRKQTQGFFSGLDAQIT